MLNHVTPTLLSKIKNDIKAKNFSCALQKIKSYVEVIISDNFLDGLLLDSKELDELCLLIGNDINQQAGSNVVIDNKNSSVILYIATELYTTGGHTAVIEDFIRAKPDHQHIILLTDLLFQSDKSKTQIQNRFSKLPVQLIWPSKKFTDFVDKVIWIQDQWRKINPKEIVLFNHHQDVAAIAAAQPTLPGKLFFFITQIIS